MGDKKWNFGVPHKSDNCYKTQTQKKERGKLSLSLKIEIAPFLDLAANIHHFSIPQKDFNLHLLQQVIAFF